MTEAASSAPSRLPDLVPPDPDGPRHRPPPLSEIHGQAFADDLERAMAKPSKDLLGGVVDIIKGFVTDLLKAGWNALATFVGRWFEATSYEHTTHHVTMSRPDRLSIWFGNVDDKATLHVNDEYVAAATINDPSPPDRWFFTDVPLKPGPNWVVIALENSGAGAYGFGCGVFEYTSAKKLFVIDHTGFELANNKHLFKAKIYVG